MTITAVSSAPASAPDRAPALEMRGISKTFPGVKALDNVQLRAWTGEIHSLMGENGAGKSTLMKILSGAYTADPGGEIRIDGQPTPIAGPKAARAAGIAIIYQELSLAPNLTVAENIYLGNESTRFGILADRAAMRRETVKVLDRLGAEFGPDTVVNTLSLIHIFSSNRRSVSRGERAVVGSSMIRMWLCWCRARAISTCCRSAMDRVSTTVSGPKSAPSRSSTLAVSRRMMARSANIPYWRGSLPR